MTFFLILNLRFYLKESNLISQLELERFVSKILQVVHLIATNEHYENYSRSRINHLKL